MWPRRRLATEVLGRRPLCRALERLSVWQGTLIGLPQSFDQTTKDCLRRHGVRLAFSLSGGHQPPDAIDRYDVPRASVGLNTTIRELSAMLTLPQLLARW